MALKENDNSFTPKKIQQISGKTHTAKLSTVKNYQPARNFRQLIELVRATEENLIANDYGDVEERIHVIRGIYYGTVWSADLSGGEEFGSQRGVPDIHALFRA